MIWYETKPLILATGYIVKKIPPEDGKELFIFSLFLLLFQNVLRVGADEHQDDCEFLFTIDVKLYRNR